MFRSGSPTKKCIYLCLFTSHGTARHTVTAYNDAKEISILRSTVFLLFRGNSTLRSTVRILIESIYAKKVPISLKVGFSAGIVGCSTRKVGFSARKVRFSAKKICFSARSPHFLHVILFGKLKEMKPSYKLLDY